jgi:hypothetical protein
VKADISSYKCQAVGTATVLLARMKASSGSRHVEIGTSFWGVCKAFRYSWQGTRTSGAERMCSDKWIEVGCCLLLLALLNGDCRDNLVSSIAFAQIKTNVATRTLKYTPVAFFSGNRPRNASELSYRMKRETRATAPAPLFQRPLKKGQNSSTRFPE